MTGGYSFPDYETLVESKKADINEFINEFMPVIREYRDNYDGKGSAFGKQRAELVYSLLNKFYDGTVGGRYAVNDTGKHLGDLFRETLRQEGNSKGGDLQQIILESSGPAVVVVEQLLALAADTGAETWIERLTGLSGSHLSENLAKYVPEAAGQDVAPSAVTAFLNQHFGDAAHLIAEGWSDVHDTLVWYEAYNEENGLWQNDGESDEAYGARVSAFFEAIRKKDQDEYEKASSDYYSAGILYDNLFETEYSGALLVAAAFVKGYQMYKYYQRKFTQIPLMIVDESDLVTYTKDASGAEVRNIEFKDYEFYAAVRCNRQSAGDIGDPQDGVDQYPAWGCGDVADLNADMGQEWLALYTVKSPNKGYPILADSLKLQYGSEAMQKKRKKEEDPAVQEV